MVLLLFLASMSSLGSCQLGRNAKKEGPDLDSPGFFYVGETYRKEGSRPKQNALLHTYARNVWSIFAALCCRRVCVESMLTSTGYDSSGGLQ